MKGKDLLEHIQDLEEDFIMEASRPTAHKKWNGNVIKVIGVAACLSLLVGSVWINSHNQNLLKNNSTSPNKQQNNEGYGGMPDKSEEMYNGALPEEAPISPEAETIPAQETSTEKVLGSSNVSMYFESINADKTGATLCLKNNINQEIIYDEYFTLEKKVDGVWTPLQVNEGYGVHDIAYILSAGEMQTMDVYWDGAYDALEANTSYRFSKKFFINGEEEVCYIEIAPYQAQNSNVNDNTIDFDVRWNEETNIHTFVIRNKTNTDITFDSDFVLETLTESGIWATIPVKEVATVDDTQFIVTENNTSTAIPTKTVYTIPSGQTETIDINIEDIYGYKLHDQYRITATFYQDEKPCTKEVILTNPDYTPNETEAYEISAPYEVTTQCESSEETTVYSGHHSEHHH